MKLKTLNLMILLVTILVLTPTIQIVLAQTSNTFWVTSGVYPHGVSYTIWREGSYYYAKDAYGKQPTWSGGTSGTTVIQNCINDVYDEEGGDPQEAGIIFLRNDIYYANLLLKAGVSLIGEDRRGTRIYGMVTVDGSFYDAWGGRIENLMIKGYEGSPSQDYSLNLPIGVGGLYLENVWIGRGKIASFRIGSGNCLNTYRHVMITSVRGTESIGILVTGNSYVDRFVDCEIQQCDYGLVVNNTSWHQNDFEQCTWQNIGKQAIVMHGGGGNLFENCWIGDPNPAIDKYILLKNDLDDVECLENKFIDCDWGGLYNNYVLAIEDGFNYTLVQDCAFCSEPHFKLYIGSNAYYTRIIRPKRLGTAGITDDSTTSYILFDENSGLASASNDDWIKHGLMDTPTEILLTVNTADARYIVQMKDSNATHFQIYLWDDTAGVLETVDKDIAWHALYTN